MTFMLLDKTSATTAVISPKLRSCEKPCNFGANGCQYNFHSFAHALLVSVESLFIQTTEVSSVANEWSNTALFFQYAPPRSSHPMERMKLPIDTWSLSV
jgi:hypothetical protein